MTRKTMTILLTAALAALTMSGCAENVAAPDAGYPLERLTLSVGDYIYHAAINQETHTATVGAIKYGGQVSRVDYKLAEGATISPDPQEFTGDWPEKQEFTVTCKDGEKTDYTVLLSAYENRFPGAEDDVLFFDDFDQPDGLDMDAWDYVPKGTAAWQVSMSGSPDQSYIQDGKLILAVERRDGESLTGGVKTQGKLWFKAPFRIEVRARFVNDGESIGQAIWMMPEPEYQTYGGWPESGEIDIMEHSYLHDYVQHTLHSYYIDIYTGQNTDHLDREYSGYNAGEYNTYTADVTDEAVIIYGANGCNDMNPDIRINYKNLHFENEAELKQWPFSGGFHIILSAGPAGTGEIADEDCPSYMEVDWVRVTKL